MQSFDAMLGCRVSVERGVPRRAGGTTLRHLSRFPFALFSVIRAPYVLLTYSVGKFLVPLPFVGLRYGGVWIRLVGPVWPSRS